MKWYAECKSLIPSRFCYFAALCLLYVCKNHSAHLQHIFGIKARIGQSWDSTQVLHSEKKMATVNGISSSVSVSQQLIPIFNGDNYQFWSIKMKTLFLSYDLWDLVENGMNEYDVERLTAAQRNEMKENKKKDAKALFYIQQALDETVFPRIMGASTSKEAWDLLKDEYKGSSQVVTLRLQTLRRDFETLMMKNSESIQEFFTKVTTIVNQIRSLGEDLKEQKVVEKVLRSLTPKFDHVVAAIEESKDLTTLSVNHLMGSLQTHEVRMNRAAEKPLEQALQSKIDLKKGSNEGARPRSSEQRSSGNGRGKKNFRGRGRGRNRYNANERNPNSGNHELPQCYNCKKRGHIEKDCWYKNKDSSVPQCSICKKFGHDEKDCWYKNKNRANFHEEKEIDEASENVFLSCLSSSIETIWYLDSGCNNHMTGEKHMFVEMNESVRSQVKIEDNN